MDPIECLGIWTNVVLGFRIFRAVYLLVLEIKVTFFLCGKSTKHLHW